MKPFFPLYFIKENKARCVLLMFMLFLGYAAYLGGIYITNLYDNWQIVVDYSEKYTTVSPSNEDENYSDFYAFTKELENNDKVDVLQLGVYHSFNWKTIMNFESGNFSATFLSVDDFRTYCAHMNIDCNFDQLKAGSLIMSERFAKNRGLEIGDTVDKDFDKGIYGKFTLDAMTQEDGYTQYFISDDGVLANQILILSNDGANVYDIAYALQEKYNVQIFSGVREKLDSQFSVFNRIYLFVLVLMAVILAVTVHATFVGMYQRRNFEFAVYRAIGLSKRRIIGKIIGELLCMDVIAMVIGGAVIFIALYLFNNLVLYPCGKYLCYFHPIALFGLVFYNLAVLVPLIVTRCKQMLKADICEY